MQDSLILCELKHTFFFLACFVSPADWRAAFLTVTITGEEHVHRVAAMFDACLLQNVYCAPVSIVGLVTASYNPNKKMVRFTYTSFGTVCHTVPVNHSLAFLVFVCRHFFKSSSEQRSLYMDFTLSYSTLPSFVAQSPKQYIHVLHAVSPLGVLVS